MKFAQPGRHLPKHIPNLWFFEVLPFIAMVYDLLHEISSITILHDNVKKLLVSVCLEKLNDIGMINSQ